MTHLHIKLISDFICPWCYLGKARLERIQAIVADEIQLDIEVSPYLLYPKIPKGGVPKSYFAKKTKPGMGKSLRLEAKKEGIQFNYKYIEYIPNSLEAHRIVYLVQDHGQKYELAKKIFYAYFETGQDIENHDYLVQEAKSVGVKDEILHEFKTNDVGLLEVKNAISANKEAFVRVVPSLQFDNGLVIPGLQSAETWERYIRRAAKMQMNS